jgi:hypothetical protein
MTALTVIFVALGVVLDMQASLGQRDRANGRQALPAFGSRRAT